MLPDGWRLQPHGNPVTVKDTPSSLYVRAAWLVIPCMALAGCETYTVVERYGVFTLSREMVANKLDGTTSLYRIRLCSSVDSSCISADNISVDRPRAAAPQDARIAVWQTGKQTGNHVQRTLSFHDAVTGATLACNNCAGPLEPRVAAYAQDTYGRFDWSPTGAAGVAYFPHGADSTRIMLLEFDAAGYRVTSLGDWPTQRLKSRSLTFAPDDLALGWYVCGQTCDLMVYERASRQLTASDVPCPYNTYLDLGWLGSRAYPEHYWGTSPDNRCLTPDGRTALPRGKGDTFQVREDDPAHPTSEDQLPPTRLIATFPADEQTRKSKGKNKRNDGG